MPFDYALYKSRCDVLLNGSAYAPDGRTVKKVQVRLRVGTMAKEFDVIGDRVWQVSKMDFTQSFPRSFTIILNPWVQGGYRVHDIDFSALAPASLYLPHPWGRQWN